MTPGPQNVRGEVERMRQALRDVVARCSPSHAEVERAAGLREGELSDILAGEIELGVAHLFRILRATGVPPRKFFRSLAKPGSGHLRQAAGQLP